MKRFNKKVKYQDNYRFIDTAVINNATYIDYLSRFRRVALSVFEWVNLPKSINSFKLEKDLYENGKAVLFKHKDYGIINTKCSSNGFINLYDLPTKLNCYAYSLQESRKLYTGLDNHEESQENDCILVYNNLDMEPTCRKYGTICI